ncbi:hypothetical protein PAEPH01_2136 [Pancytospora epiphaga]|nr:hypothetical protein PAEPH01_2136 [Pancytospora epiphaga]
MGLFALRIQTVLQAAAAKISEMSSSKDVKDKLGCSGTRSSMLRLCYLLKLVDRAKARRKLEQEEVTAEKVFESVKNIILDPKFDWNSLHKRHFNWIKKFLGSDHAMFFDKSIVEEAVKTVSSPSFVKPECRGYCLPAQCVLGNPKDALGRLKGREIPPLFP